MTKNLTLLFLIPLMLSLSAHAQTALHVPFGQTLQQVKTFLSSRDYISEININDRQDTLSAKAGKQVLTYIFQEDKLYSISNSILFDDKKLAEEQYKTCVNYYELRRSDVKNLSAGAAGRSIVAIEDKQIAEVQSIPNKETETVSVAMTITSRMYGPRSATEEFARRMAAR